jgi:hypothetical protein
MMLGSDRASGSTFPLLKYPSSQGAHSIFFLFLILFYFIFLFLFGKGLAFIATAITTPRERIYPTWSALPISRPLAALHQKCLGG